MNDLRIILARDNDPPTRHLGRWRLTVIERGGPVISGLNHDGEACPVAPFDEAARGAFDTYMFSGDAPYRMRQVGAEAFEVSARGRAVIFLAEFCRDLVEGRA